ncbi:MAG: retron Ec78 anti-phage system effector HNH endonuclease PtuB [Pseudomonadota bacterium]
MHKLKRPKPPACLAKYRHGLNNWSDITTADRAKIWESLDIMQQKRCAYCENRIKTEPKDNNAHIEHFRQRSRYPQGTFEWEKIFASCNRQESCGKYKDSLPHYNHADVIKMDVEDPEDFFLFGYDGTISIRPNLSAQEKHRAKETLRIFNLDAKHGPLRQMRQAAVQGYYQTAEELAEMAKEFPEEEWYPLLEEELEAINELPFATAIKHVLMP